LSFSEESEKSCRTGLCAELASTFTTIVS